MSAARKRAMGCINMLRWLSKVILSLDYKSEVVAYFEIVDVCEMAI